MSDKIQETFDLITDLKKQLGYQGCRNCINQIEPFRMCEWAEQKTAERVHIICPKWERKDTPSEK